MKRELTHAEAVAIATDPVKKLAYALDQLHPSARYVRVEAIDLEAVVALAARMSEVARRIDAMAGEPAMPYDPGRVPAAYENGWNEARGACHRIVRGAER